ncbi:MAG: hypothetical protein OXE48_06370 [Gammaproteobacteria bacterium]|nr:hypothetical protein [Gammaproteobacteria bacterium]
MTPVITALVAQWPVLLAIAILYILHRQDIKLIEQKIDSINTRFDDINKRFDDLKESINTRFNDINKRLDDQNQALNTLSQKVDALSGRVHRIEGHLSLPRTGTEG